MSTVNSSVQKTVDDFIDDYHLGNIQVRDEASEKIAYEQGQRLSLKDFLVQAIYNYDVSKNVCESVLEDKGLNIMEFKQAEKECCYWLSDCYYWILQLRAQGLIGETESMKSKLVDKEKEVEQLKEQIDQLTTKYLDCKQLNEELNKVLGNFGERGNSSFAERKP